MNQIYVILLWKIYFATKRKVFQTIPDNRFSISELCNTFQSGEKFSKKFIAICNFW